MLTILLQAQANPLKPIITLLGFAIAMIWLFTRNSKKNKKDDPNSEENKNKML